MVQNRTAGGSLTWLESYVRAKTLTQSRKTGVFVSPGIKKTSLAKRCHASPSWSGGGLPVTAPACVNGLEMPLAPEGSRSEHRAWGLPGFCPGEATGSRGTGAWPCRGWGPGPLGEGVHRPPFQRKGRKPGRFGGAVGKSVLSQLIALTPGQIPATRWPLLLSTDICDIERGAMPFCAWPPFIPLCPPEPIHLSQGKWKPGEKSGAQAHRSCQQQEVTPVTFLPRSHICSLGLA